MQSPECITIKCHKSGWNRYEAWIYRVVLGKSGKLYWRSQELVYPLLCSKHRWSLESKAKEAASTLGISFEPFVYHNREYKEGTDFERACLKALLAETARKDTESKKVDNKYVRTN